MKEKQDRSASRSRGSKGNMTQYHEPQNAGSSWKMKKARKLLLPQSLQKNPALLSS